MDYAGAAGDYLNMARVHLRTVTGQEYSVSDERLPIECFRCGICCMGYYPQLSDEEIERLAGHLAISTEEFISEYVQVTKIGYLLRQTESGCVFLTWEKACPERSRRDTPRALCSIHPFRPDACRNWVPSLFRRECKEGLAKLQKDNGIMRVGEIYDTQEQLERFCASLRQPNIRKEK